jgi:GNAT superfamily N-acetyltransferase
MYALRPAVAADLPQLWDIFYEGEVQGEPNPPPKADVPGIYRHEMDTGTMLVAERAGLILGFAATITRGETTFLTDFFVRREQQSSGVGSSLLAGILPQDGRACWTSSSADVRALGLYVRRGLQPLWPGYSLVARSASLAQLPTRGVEVLEADPGDAQLAAWDTEIGGRHRPPDHAYWVRETRARPLWLWRLGRRIGYAYVQMRNDEHVWHANALTVGPVGTRDAADAVDGVCGVVEWARARGPELRLFVPAPHPVLAPLLHSGFRIAFVDTLMSSTGGLFAEPTRYLPSGASLF